MSDVVAGVATGLPVRGENDTLLAERDTLRRQQRRLFTKSGNFRTAKIIEVSRGALRSLLHDHPDIDMPAHVQEMVAKRIAGQIESWIRESPPHA